jgi:rhamnosyltransferase
VISVVIPVLNGGEPMRRCLEAIRSQKVSDDVEIVAVDSGSTDGTQDLVRSFDGRVHEIAPEDFNHGETRNLGARLAAGEIVVFTVDDALAVDDRWLEQLTEPLRVENRLAGTYARQIAYEGAPLHQSYYIDHRYGPEPRLQRASGADELTVANVLFSNVSSAIRKPLLEEFPFASDIVIAEDLEWCTRVLLAGYEIAYVPEAVVRHSHDYTLGDALKRYFDQGAAAERSFMAGGRSSPRRVRGEGVRFVRDELAWLWEDGRRSAIPYTLAHEATRFAGFQLGVHHRRVPRWLRSRISRTSVYWS